MLRVHKKVHELQGVVFEASWGFKDPTAESRTFGKLRSRFQELVRDCATYWPEAAALVERGWAEISRDGNDGLPPERVNAAIRWLSQAHANIHTYDAHDEGPRDVQPDFIP